MSNPEFFTNKMLMHRWSCSRMTIERLKQNDPDFPPAYKFGLRKETRRREDIENYERSRVMGRSRSAALVPEARRPS